MTPGEQLAAAEAQIRVANAVALTMNMFIENGVLQKDLIHTRMELDRAQQEIAVLSEERAKYQVSDQDQND